MMMRRTLLRAAVHAQRVCSRSGGEPFVCPRAWSSSTAPGGESSDSDGSTPAETKLSFSSTVYGKDPSGAVELSAAESAAAEELKRAARAPDGASAFKGHDARALFDSPLAQQAEDGKSSSDIKRHVHADTPDATRVAFRAAAYGKDPQMAAILTEEEAVALEALRSNVDTNCSSRSNAAPIHDSRNMYDPDLEQGASSMPASDEIKRDVVADTPDATRVAFRASVYGKDPEAAAELSADEAAQVEYLRRGVERPSAADIAPVHDARSMFDSDLEHGAGSGQTSDAIKREVEADTPDATRVAFRAMVYGKDPQAAVVLSAEEAAEVAAMREKAIESRPSAGAAPVHDKRSMFDSDLEQGAGASLTSVEIKREVAADTPEATRLVFGGSDYGKDPRSMARTAEEEAKVQELAARAGRQSAEAAEARRAQAPVHHERSMFDSDLTQGAGLAEEYAAIKRDVEADTPPLTRLSFFGSTYGDGSHRDDEGVEAEDLEKQTKNAKLVAVGGGVRRSKVHDTKKAMRDDTYSQEGSE